MRLYLFRHAERENSGQQNPSLSSRGKKQALHLSDLVSKSILEQPNRLLASPKARAIETLKPVSEFVQRELVTLSLFDERQNSESGEQFAHRVRGGLLEAIDSPGVVFLCTHLDWIEEALLCIPTANDILLTQHQIWEPGQHMVFDIHDGNWNLVQFGHLRI